MFRRIKLREQRLPGDIIIIISTFDTFSDDTFKVDSRLTPSQWETPLQSNAVFHWLCANLNSALYIIRHDNLWDSVCDFEIIIIFDLATTVLVFEIRIYRSCRPGGRYCDHLTGTLSISPIIVNHLMEFTSTWSMMFQVTWQERKGAQRVVPITATRMTCSITRGRLILISTTRSSHHLCWINPARVS